MSGFKGLTPSTPDNWDEETKEIINRAEHIIVTRAAVGGGHVWVTDVEDGATQTPAVFLVVESDLIDGGENKTVSVAIPADKVRELVTEMMMVANFVLANGGRNTN